MDFVKKNENKKRVLPNGTESWLMGHTEEMTVVRSNRPAGLIFPPHQHPAVQVYIIKSGKMEVTVGEVTRIMEAGDTWIISGNVPHGCKVLERCEEIEVFVPGRPELAELY